MIETPYALGSLAISLLSSCALAYYLQWGPFVLTWIVVLALTIAALLQRPFTDVKLKHLVAIGVLSALLSFSLVLGHNIVIAEPYYESTNYGLHNSIYYLGLYSDNYVTSFGVLDILAFFGMLPALFTLLLTPIALAMRKRAEPPVARFEAKSSNRAANNCLPPISWKWVWGGAAIVFVLWVPYLLAYWPGLIFGDSLNSIREVIGMQKWDDHFPVAYTAFIGLCFWIANFFGLGNTGGCALYTILQMLFMACCFSYVSQWIATRMRLRRIWGIAIALFFGLVPFVAIYSVSMWKDPSFAAAIAVVTTMLFDYAQTDGAIASGRKAWLFALIVLLAIIGLFRSNGLMIILFLALIFIVDAVRKARKHEDVKGPVFMTLATASITVAVLVFGGPVTTALGIAKVGSNEGAGVLYNQMARVVVYHGVVSEHDEEYLDSMLPIDRYSTTYRPCCFDELKYAMQDNGAQFEIAQLMPRWFSMFLSNPGLCFESWELQTFGFWAINRPELALFPNVASGTPRNTTQEGDYATEPERQAEIHLESKLPGDADFWRTVFPQDMWTPPASFFFWIAVYLACFCFLTNRKKWAIALLPTLLLFFSMFIATPLCYWPRYVAAAYFLIPFYVFLFYALFKPGIFSLQAKNRRR